MEQNLEDQTTQLAEFTKQFEIRAEYVPNFFDLFFRELRKQIEQVREETAKFKESEKESHQTLDKLKEEFQAKKKKVFNLNLN